MTHRTKNILLMIGFVLALLICYHWAIGKTLDLKKQHESLKKQEALFGDTPRQMSILKQKEAYYKGLLDKYQLNGSSVQNNLLKTINSYSDSSGIRVVSFMEPHVIENNNLKISTYQFSLEGDFNHILELIHLLEQKTKFGEIINLYFEKKKNFKTGKQYLQAHVLLKSFG